MAKADEPQRVLFIGNSYTGANKLPELFTEIVKSSGYKVPLVKSASPGGLTLEKQLACAPSLALIGEGNWDAVILQGQSQEPAMAEKNPQMRDSFVSSAAALCKYIRAKSPKAKIYFYETWARHPDYWTDPTSSKDALVLGSGPKDMQARLSKWYRKVATDNNATLVPVGTAWALNYDSANPIRLHNPDNSHPNFNGSYLAGLIIFGKIYSVTKPEVQWHDKLPEAEVKLIQEYAAKALK